MTTIPPKFRLQAKRVHLTYKGHLIPSQVIGHFAGTNPLISDWSIVNETSDENYEHTHVLFEFSKAIDTTNSRRFDIDGNHPNIQPVKNAAHWKKALAYHHKQGVPVVSETLRAKLSQSPVSPKDKKPQPIKETLEKYDTARDALLEGCMTFSQVGGVIAAFNYKRPDFGEEPVVKWRPWQQALIDEITLTDPDPRHIIWYYDEKGNSGKTFLAKHMGMHREAFVSTRANAYHVATQLQQAMLSGGAILIVMFNFSRQQENHKIYQALEEIKDGMMSCEKYKGSTIYFKIPHLVVFANYEPFLECCSLDRWDIRTIHNDGTITRTVEGVPEPMPKAAPTATEVIEEITAMAREELVQVVPATNRSYYSRQNTYLRRSPQQLPSTGGNPLHQEVATRRSIRGAPPPK